MSDKAAHQESQEERSTRFMSKGLLFGTIMGVVGGSLYAMSDYNTNVGSFLSWEVNLVLIGIPIASMGIAWLLAKL